MLNRADVHNNRLLSKSQAADYLGLGVRSIDRMIQAGSLTAVRLGRRVRINQAQVTSIVAGGIDRIATEGTKI